MITSHIEIEGTAPDHTLWCDIKDVKAELGLTGTDEEGSLLKRIQRASDRLLRFTNLRGVAFCRYKETLPGMGDTSLMVTRTPIVNLLAVEIVSAEILIEGATGQDVTDSVLLEDRAAGFLFRKYGWGWSAMRSAPLGLQLSTVGAPMPGTEEPVYRIDYEAGWMMPKQKLPTETGTEVPVNFPADLEQACLAQVIWDYRHVRRTADVKSKKVGDTTLTYETGFGNDEDSVLARRFGLCPDAFYLANPMRRAA
ncbi:MAG: hypothetical protein GY769_04455 [bacterium]|nr:hypothetical protein [bacterium]